MKGAKLPGLVLLSLTACASSPGQKPPPPPDHARTAPATPPSAVPPPAPAEASAAPAPSRPGGPPLADPIAPSPSAVLNADITFSPGFDVLHSTLGPLLVFSSGKGRLPAKLGVAKDGKVVEAPYLASGLAAIGKDPRSDRTPPMDAPYRVYIRAITGDFPKAAFLILDRINERTQPGRGLIVMQWRKNKWAEVKGHPFASQGTIPPFDGVVRWEMPPEPIALSLGPWATGPLALVTAGKNGEPTFIEVEKAEKSTWYGLAPCKKDCVVDASFSFSHKECKTLLDPRVLVSGDMSAWVFGDQCKDGAPAMEGFPMQKDYRIHEAPGDFAVLPSNLDVLAGVAKLNVEVLVVGSRIARWDGKTWTPVPRPKEMLVSAEGFALDSVSMLEDGTLWMTERHDKKVWRRRPDGTWAHLSLPSAPLSKKPGSAPAPFIPTSVTALPSGEAWVTGCLEGARPEEPDFSSYADDEEERAVSPDCGAYFVKPR